MRYTRKMNGGNNRKALYIDITKMSEEQIIELFEREIARLFYS